MADMAGFDANQEAPLQVRGELLPQMKALAVIVNSDKKPTKTGGGERMEFAYEIMQPEQFKGRKIYSGHNIKNANPIAQKIAGSEVAAICKAVGVLAPRDSVQLHNLPLVIDIRIKKRDDAGHVGELQNEIANWEPKATPLTPPQPLPQQTPTAPAGAGQPWANPAAPAPGPGASPF